MCQKELPGCPWLGDTVPVPVAGICPLTAPAQQLQPHSQGTNSPTFPGAASGQPLLMGSLRAFFLCNSDFSPCPAGQQRNNLRLIHLSLPCSQPCVFSSPFWDDSETSRAVCARGRRRRKGFIISEVDSVQLEGEQPLCQDKCHNSCCMIHAPSGIRSFPPTNLPSYRNIKAMKPIKSRLAKFTEFPPIP